MKTQIEVRENGMVFINGRYIPNVTKVSCDWNDLPTITVQIANYELLGSQSRYKEMGIL